MLRTLCKSKIKNAYITDTQLHYEGSIGVDRTILEEADILPGEQVHVLNTNNGERLVTYVIEEKDGSGKMVLYGPAARRGEAGDEITILSYCQMETKESRNFNLRSIVLGKNNQLKGK